MSMSLEKRAFYAFVGIALLGLVLGAASLAIVLSPTTQSAGRVQRFRIIMGEGEVIAEVQGEDVLTGEYHRWEPGTIVVNQGDRVILEIVNPRKNIHSFVLSAFNIDTGQLQPRGGSATVEFTADKAGVFQFLCGTPQNKELKHCDPDHSTMVGYFIVLQA